LNKIDVLITTFLNQFAGKYPLLDHIAFFVSVNHLCKGAVLMGIFWYLWFHPDPWLDKKRKHMVATLLGTFVAMFFARILPKVLPFRSRPINDELLQLKEPIGLNKEIFDSMSSFPSDHATLFFALVGGIFYISKRWGYAALLYTIIFIAFPRLYLGLHYLSDIIGGAIIGLIVIAFFNTSKLMDVLTKPILVWRDKRPEFFKLFFFLITFQIAEMFESSRQFVSFLLDPLKPLL
jgi:undecaprenyl-diphosphatase